MFFVRKKVFLLRAKNLQTVTMPKTQDSLKNIKFVIAGLDNAGKTSFLIALRQKYNFHDEIKNLKPTVRIEYSSLNFLNRWKINFWDMGGQERYREEYLDKPVYFSDTTFFYYFIDIQDESKFQESINYLNELLKVYSDFNFNREIIVCLNKSDPDLRDDKEISNRIKEIKKLVNILNEQFKFEFFNTTFYDISTITKVVSYSLNTLIKLNDLTKILQRIVRNLKSIYAVLYTDSGLIVADYFEEKLNPKEYLEVITSQVNEDLVLIQKLVGHNTLFLTKLSHFDDKSEFIIKYNLGSNNFYLRIIAPILEKEQVRSEIKDFQNDLIRVFT